VAEINGKSCGPFDKSRNKGQMHLTMSVWGKSGCVSMCLGKIGKLLALVGKDAALGRHSSVYDKELVSFRTPLCLIDGLACTKMAD
jgi:hypothetical protein